MCGWIGIGRAVEDGAGWVSEVRSTGFDIEEGGEYVVPDGGMLRKQTSGASVSRLDWTQLPRGVGDEGANEVEAIKTPNTYQWDNLCQI